MLLREAVRAGAPVHRHASVRAVVPADDGTLRVAYDERGHTRHLRAGAWRVAVAQRDLHLRSRCASARARLTHREAGKARCDRRSERRRQEYHRRSARPFCSPVLLARHLDPDNGAVLLDDQDLKSLKLADARRHVVVVDQDPFVFNASIQDNIRFARPDATEGDIREAVVASGLADFVAGSPDGLGTIVGERGKALSAGERQRLAIARAFVVDPTVLVLDEATGALDPATERQVVAGYEAVMRGRTTVVITHRLALAQLADRIIVLQGDRIAEEGTPAELMAKGEAFTALFVVSPDATAASLDSHA
ncbi:MAG: hypothetical protein CK531_08275 [Gemmatimonadetes bacterium]|nr:MAG: hypothetical protein CK531_10415 [Gemmatimonadota bacterium]PHX96679.1 MAG: hypothetical protein CK531_08275 [Gemmatimonadota bacterium]